MRSVKHVLSTIAAFAIAVILVTLCGGCPVIPGELTEAQKEAAVLKLATAFEGLDTLGAAGIVALNEATAFRGRVAKFNVDLNREIDLDATAGGVDLFPNATGKVQITGTINISGTTLTVNNLKATLNTDVVVTDPVSGAIATFKAGDFVSYTASGTFTLNLLTGTYTSAIQTQTTVADFAVKVQLADAVPVSLTFDCTSVKTFTYTDDALGNGLPGVLTFTVDSTAGATWSEFIWTYTVALDILIENTTGAVTLTVNDEIFGPFTLQEFMDTYNSELFANYGG